MSLIIGNDKIKSIYVGDQKIKKAYLGKELVYSSKKKPSDGIVLPSGYTRVQYIIGNGAMLSGIYDVPVVDTSDYVYFEAKYSIKDCLYSQEYYLCGAGAYDSINVAGTRAQYGLKHNYSSGNGDVRFYSGMKASPVAGSYSVIVPYNYETDSGNIDIAVDNTNRIVTINGEELSFTPGRIYLNDTLPRTIPFSPFGYVNWHVRYVNYQATRSLIYSSPEKNAKLYYFKWFSPEGELMHHLIPCKNSSGTVGVYDIIEDKFINAYSTGKFLAGPEV